MDLRLVMLAPPGAGKGTQSRILSRRHGIPHIETGNILRAAMRNGTELGQKAARFIDDGNLVPDDVMEQLVFQRLGEPDCEDGFVLDGFPRTIPQARATQTKLQESERRLSAVVFLDVSEDVIYERLEDRRVCSNCGRTYHLREKPPETEGVCDNCGSELVRREDDTRDAIRRRLKVYRERTRPLLDFYRRRDLLLEVDGERSIEEVEREIDEGLKRRFETDRLTREKG